MGEPRQRGSAGSLWESIFDPANARLLADAQAQGLRAASDLVEGVLAGLAGGGDDEPTDDLGGRPSSSASSSGVSSSSSEEAGRVLEAWTDVLRAIAATVDPTRSPPAGNGSGHAPVGLDLTAPGGVQLLSLAVGPSGEGRDGPVRVWLHNGAETSTGPLALGVGELRSPDGRTLAAALTFDPPVVELPPHTSRGVAISVAAAETLEVGTYRGLAQVAGAPELWLPVEVTVTEGAGASEDGAGEGRR